MSNLRDVKSFGKVEAEEDAILTYFVEMDVTERILDGSTFLILGRKGSGKTALFRYFCESKYKNHSVPLNLNGYPWKIHERVFDGGVEEIESYVASWKYLIAVEFAKKVLELTDRPQMKEVVELRGFLKDNYGDFKPLLRQILSPKNLIVKGDLEPQIFGCKLGKISLSREGDNLELGNELNALTERLFSYIKKIAEISNLQRFYVHFDELDRGLTGLTDKRKNLIVGLILAAKESTRLLKSDITIFNPVVYLRTDIWEKLKFSDRNKIYESNSDLIEWDHKELFNLIQKRVQVLLGNGYNWSDIDDGKKINSQPKWKHIVDRSLMRPRDVISFLNILLEVTKKRKDEVLKFSNKDVVEARSRYSNYLKNELDDEIRAHWEDWEDSLTSLSRLGRIYFKKPDYEAMYNEITLESENKLSYQRSLEELYNFSVIEYESRSGYGGTSWKSKFANPEAGWDLNAIKFKIHLGLKEHLKLKEERS